MATLMSRPNVSSPLANSTSSTRGQSANTHPLSRRNPAFATSRALRPFPSIAQSLQPSAGSKKAIKIIEAPKHQTSMFVLDLTQAEFSRKD
ncbi:hypothetical protein AGABI1DRAFT_81208 [Agaricus bisporus var. burnettii JB137-S8]|uniref:Uncharacterized protein n=1 Tax=Agaricus bisporus var. burnettii (strain JB137-S8 / ATCC MYA-4627 / FGSC 10392) TaxID=597362 RepID=K5XIW4_AGABU|nr:hypothetical protein AGABI2DRAFT_133441 [Agaricus bisporus var. bisporus H97]XP_007325251.1 uncharacterized protein AGABI1DRAFT_81208 [Agaricus bisporus var. burnettii JB137-S8]EKM83433.1 hypothetical protein AGABI1DRAFT_81208 [Agaricus bisporus var. burnettii JB137-S8]EKV51795.1 hypothetical protein AGABI2DRAFT_133441 [Agaricus bisporus var. bisporus H97]